MKAWECNRCGAEIKDSQIKACPLCKSKDFSEIELPDLTAEDIEMNKKYEEALKKIEEYEEGTPPKKMEGCCGTCGTCDKEE